MNIIRSVVQDYMLNKELIYFEVNQYKQPTQYISISKDQTIIELHKHLSKIVDCSAKIRDVCISYNNMNVVSVPVYNSKLTVYEFIESKQHNIDISFNFSIGFLYIIYIMDDQCVRHFQSIKLRSVNNKKNSVGLQNNPKEFELININITDTEYDSDSDN
jgi:hypothetical protein